jgi:hypothetical protein
MDHKLLARLQARVADWARMTYDTEDVVIGEAARDDDDDAAPVEEEAVRYLVDFAVRRIGFWSVAEVWVADGHVLSINDLGEGLPLDGTEWPWISEGAA